MINKSANLVEWLDPFIGASDEYSTFNTRARRVLGYDNLQSVTHWESNAADVLSLILSRLAREKSVVTIQDVQSFINENKETLFKRITAPLGSNNENDPYLVRQTEDFTKNKGKYELADILDALDEDLGEVKIVGDANKVNFISWLNPDDVGYIYDRADTILGERYKSLSFEFCRTVVIILASELATGNVFTKDHLSRWEYVDRDWFNKRIITTLTKEQRAEYLVDRLLYLSDGVLELLFEQVLFVLKTYADRKEGE